MPVPAIIRHRLPVGMDHDLLVDSEVLLGFFAEHKTTCEFPQCTIPAEDFFYSNWVMAWVCSEHLTQATEASSRWSKELGVLRLDEFLTWSFVVSNRRSDFELEVQMAAAAKYDAKVNDAILLGKDPSQTKKSVRAQARQFTSKPGQPDPEN